MKKLLITITAFILLNAFFYLLISFCNLDIDFRHWGIYSRSLLSILSAGSMIILIMERYSKPEKTKY